jgi:hypothetical protein
VGILLLSVSFSVKCFVDYCLCLCLSGLSGDLVAQSLLFYEVFCRSLFVPLSFRSTRDRPLCLIGFAFLDLSSFFLWPIHTLDYSGWKYIFQDLPYCSREEFEDTKGVIRIRISKNRQQWPKEKLQKDKQQSTKHTYKTKDRATQTPLKAGCEVRCSGRVAVPAPLVTPVVLI